MGKIQKKYVELKDDGVSASEMAKILSADGINGIERLSIIKQLFGLNLKDAKEAIIIGDGTANSLNEHQQKLAAEITQFLDSTNNEDL